MERTLFCLTRDEIKGIFDKAGITDQDDLPASEFANELDLLDELIASLLKKGLSDKEAQALAVRTFLIQQRQRAQRVNQEVGEPQDPHPAPALNPPPLPEKEHDSEPPADPNPTTPSPGPGGKPDKPGKVGKRRKDKKKKKGKRSAPPGGRKRGVGNRTATSYPNARTLTILLGHAAAPGGSCPCCRQGKIHALSPTQTLRFEAGQLIIPVLLSISRSRCGGCGQVFAGELPPEFRPDIALGKATPEAAALSILMRNGLGFPDLRLDRLQEWQNAPFDNSRQWRMSETGHERLRHLADAFTFAAANASKRSVDDCSVRIIEHHLAIQEEIANAAEAGFGVDKVRSGVNITTYIAEYQGRTYTVFLPGRQHQGEREWEFSRLRETDDPLLRVSDAASKTDCLKPFPERNQHGFTPRNSGKKQGNKTSSEEATTVTSVAFCLEHLRQGLKRGRVGHRREIDHLLAILGKVFDVDAETRDMTPEERLVHHQRLSAPLMAEFRAFVERELAGNRTAEPNGEYRKALSYPVNHWDGLTAFLCIPGVPLTTNDVESANRFTKQQNRPSLAYQTQFGAECGAFFMSLIATCLGVGKNPLAYLTAILRYWQHITCENAFEWTPHDYEAAVKKAQKAEEKAASAQGYELRHRRKRDPEESPWGATNPAPHRETAQAPPSQSALH